VQASVIPAVEHGAQGARLVVEEDDGRQVRRQARSWLRSDTVTSLAPTAGGSLIAAGMMPKKARSGPTSMTLRTGWRTAPAENCAIAPSMAAIRSGIGSTRRTSCSVNSRALPTTPPAQDTIAS
jgi:hypothetical protein